MIKPDALPAFALLYAVFGERPEPKHEQDRLEGVCVENGSYDYLKTLIVLVLETLTDRERTVLIGRFGLGNGERCTLQEIGISMGVTRERIRQIESQALRRMRHRSRSRRLRHFLPARAAVTPLEEIIRAITAPKVQPPKIQPPQIPLCDNPIDYGSLMPALHGSTIRLDDLERMGLGLHPRIIWALKRADIHTVGALAERSPYAVRTLGKKAIAEVEDRLAQLVAKAPPLGMMH